MPVYRRHLDDFRLDFVLRGRLDAPGSSLDGPSLTVSRADMHPVDGRVLREWRKVKVPGHAEEVLKTARERATA